MDLSEVRVLVAGGAGFVGSHLTESLLNSGTEVVVADDFSNGRRTWIPGTAEVHEVDLTNPDAVESLIDDDIDIVFHLAARSDANDEDPRAQFAENTAMTHNLLAACRESGVERFAFASSSTVYGEAPRPTPENHAPLEPISVYGASKLGEEGLVSTYAHSYDMECWLFRFANVVGPRLRGAVIPDFIEKLQENPERLQILGDGRQKKSFLHVTDCVNAMQYLVTRTPKTGTQSETMKRSDGSLHTYNIGTKTSTSVDEVAAVVCEVLGLDPEFEYTGGERGWTGDVPKMRLSIKRLTELGWEPTHESNEAVRLAAEELAAEL